MEIAKCPYCRSEHDAGLAHCASCGESLPWMVESASIRNLIKERESNRVTATATLVEEVVEASKSGKPVSLAAIKGFIFSWLFPRSVIVIGSVLGAVLLGLQTLIVWKQTTILSRQTLAAQLDQATKLRERISVEAAHADRLRQLLDAYATSIVLTCPVLADCGDILVSKSLSTVGQKDQAMAEPVRAAWLGYSSQLEGLDSRLRQLKELKEIGPDAREQPTQIVREVIAPATVQCLFDPGASRTLVRSASAFNILVGNAFWIPPPLNDVSKFQDAVEQFPQVGENTRMGVLQFQSAAINIAEIARPETARDTKDMAAVRERYNLVDLDQDARMVQRQVVDGLRDLIAACNRAAEEDEAALKEMQTRPK